MHKYFWKLVIQCHFSNNYNLYIYPILITPLDAATVQKDIDNIRIGYTVVTNNSWIYLYKNVSLIQCLLGLLYGIALSFPVMIESV